MIGVPLSPLPLVKSAKEPIKSVRRLGVVPCVTICPTRLVAFSSFSLIYPLIASFNSSPSNPAKSLSAKYFNFTSFGVPSNPFV